MNDLRKKYNSYINNVIKHFKIEDNIEFRKKMAELIINRDTDDLDVFNKKQMMLVLSFSNLSDEEIDEVILKE